MRVHVVSDVHARADALAKAGDGADAFICLGDLVLFLDYDDPSGGIFADLFGTEAAVRLIQLRFERRFDEARAFSGALWASLGEGTPREHIERQIRGQYADLFAAMPTPAYVTYGNVDVPGLYADYVRDGVTVLDGDVTTIGDRTFSFVGGGLRTPMHTPYEIDDDDYAAKV
ncbi:MAG: metallophosphoesterase, partial [Frankiales bacterium]|nr:metallophosphoesterase [Frankiales bacterium]